MTRRSSKNQRRQPPGEPDRRKPAAVIDYAPRDRAAQVSIGALWYVGLLALIIALASSLMLVLEHLAGLELPGCGKGSACAAAANSVWGKVPITSNFAWPVAFMGFAYFLGALAAWLGCRRGVSPLFRHVARLGAAISLGFIIVIVTQNFHCVYCLVSHAGNFAFWLVLELTRRGPVGSRRPLGALAGFFLASSAVLLALEVKTRAAVQTQQEAQLAESTAEIIAATAQQAAMAQAIDENAGTAADVQGRPRDSVDESRAAGTSPSPTSPTLASDASAGQQSSKQPAGFRGRYLYGPEKAPIRLVMITDYQCTDCNRSEDDVRLMLQQRNDVSLSIKHFPMCKDCNSRFADRNMHPNACWAARAAEAAGILGGNEGFWKMHFWLFDHNGSFTDQILREGVAQLGFDTAQFIQIMMGDETLRLVQADIEEAISLGLFFTPMVFINGVELRGVFTKNAIPTAVTNIAAHHPPPMTHEFDRAPSAIEKAIGDWRESRIATLPADQRPWTTGPPNARVQIVLWGDYQESGTVGADGDIRVWMTGRSDTQYSFRHFPFNRDCNPALQPTSPSHPQACRMSQAAEAAGQLGGVEGYWKMHAWLMDHLEDFSDDLLLQAASGMGFDTTALFAAMDNPETAAAIQEDLNAGRNFLYRSGIPTVYINGKVVPRWRLEGQPLLAQILDEASNPSQGTQSAPQSP